jgi:polyisoprenoid-binding protein YceI
MKPTFLFLLTAAGAFATEVYEIRPGPGTLMELTVDKTGLLSGKQHRFSFREYRGTLMFDREAPERSTVALSIESASALLNDGWLSAKDLRKAQEYAVKDMLAADRYPRITFRSTAITRADANRYLAQGMLTIRAISKPVSLMVSFRADSSGAPIIEGMSVIRLTDFGLKPPTAALGTIGTKNEMPFRFALAPSKRNQALTEEE